MDCVIPGHSVRNFCAAISCLSRVGKDLYVEFDPIDGLALRSLNDAKSAYACMRYRPSFFERCTAPPRKRSLTGESQDERFSCRVAMRALSSVVRGRKDVACLRVRSETTSSALYLSFEYHLQKGSTLLRVVHRVHAADADSISALAGKENASEIVADPKVLTRLLEPLRRTSEATLVVRKDAERIYASSFHHSETTCSDNAVSQAASAALLKTDTSTAVEELDEFFFVSSRDDEDAPASVNDQVVLVFPVKEATAMLRFCSSQDLRVTLSFYWGGRPLVMEASTESLAIELVLATLEHKLLADGVAAGGGDGNNNQ